MRRLVLSILGAFVPVSVVLAAATGYHVVGEIKIGGEGGWDYLTVDTYLPDTFKVLVVGK
jgi:hypothetical protein